MRRVGIVVNTAQGLAIVRSPDGTHPEIGVTVVDDQLDPVGRVVDVIGPTARPYVVVSPRRPSDTSLLDTKLYIR